MKKTIFVFSALIIALLALFQLSKYTFIAGDTSIEFIIAIVAVVFLGLGFYINQKSSKSIPRKSQEINSRKMKELGISEREYEVLLEISNGLSNREIGEKLFVSESTIKTHVSNLLVKLDAKRRTQAVQKAKELHLIGG
ncbi:response regulator transcription factor [Flagellimonas lutaonensis]|uniref:Regulatory protein n=1 Tax=Flagellimonas lutaonensis TaxID=516051 RepID=A0A0D5YTU4_9FLAO|nr:response regulator transcription factor [Allomuricauda lutaonensis]AKA35296.1 Regulatory protein [Allomuricauda lutaonensis]